MRVTTRWWFVVAVVAALALSGCVRLRTDVVITSDAQVTVTVDSGIKKTSSVAGSSSLCSTDSGMLPQNSVREPYDDGVYVGCRITATGPASSLGTGMTVTHADGSRSSSSVRTRALASRCRPRRSATSRSG